MNPTIASAKRRVGNIARQALRLLAHRYPGDLNTVHEQVHLRRLFDRFDVDFVFDIGANSGQYAQMLRNQVGYTGHIASFEPIPKLAEILRSKSAGDPKWSISETALSDQEATVEFHIMKSDQFSTLGTPADQPSLEFSRKNSVRKTITVTTQTLEMAYHDAYRQFGFERPFLKMDTQGFDLAVVRGGQKVLQSFVGIQSELSIVPLYQEAPLMEEALACYREHGFSLSAFVPNNEGHFPNLIEMDAILIREDPSAGGRKNGGV
ncbi:MAG: FkbM family methyltransferase [Pseudomonadota bacterium]